MTVNATDADDGINVNNGIIGYSILSEEPKSAQQMFTINREKGIISVIGTGLDREVGTLTESWGAVWQLCGGTCCGEPGMPEPRGLAGSGTCHPWATVPCSGGVCSPKPIWDLYWGRCRGPQPCRAPGVGGLPALRVGSRDIGECLCWR